MPYPYLGTAPRMYPQYRDTEADAPLQPEPGGSYSMAPVPGNGELPVPPGDGLWGPETAAPAEPAEKKAGEPEPPAGPAVKVTRNDKAAPAADGEA